MGRRLKKSSLFFGQTAQDQETPKPTLTGFYKGVGEGQVGAVQDVTKGVQETTEKLPGEFGIKYGAEGKTEFADKTPFKPSVDIKTSVTPTAAPDAGFTTSEQATKAAEQAEKNIEKIEEERKEAEAALGKSTGESLTKAGEASKTAQERLTEKKLGERREASELEKAAQDYRNILQTTPGTSNVATVANLMKFYDPKYQSLESSLRQGEISLARQQAGTTEAAMQQAEGERAASVEGYKQTSTQAYEDTKKLIDKEKQDKLAKIEEFYGGLSKKEKESGATAGEKAKELKAIEDKAETDKFNTITDTLTKNETLSGLDKIIRAISGRASNNWLNTRGNEVLGKLKGEISGLVEDSIRIKNDPNLSIKERTKQLESINNSINGYRSRIAGELAAFLGDQNTQSGDALDAAEQIVNAGLINDLTPEQKKVIMDRLYWGQGPTVDEKRQKVYSAFGGGSLEYSRNQAKELRDQQQSPYA